MANIFKDLTQPLTQELQEALINLLTSEDGHGEWIMHYQGRDYPIEIKNKDTIEIFLEENDNGEIKYQRYTFNIKVEIKKIGDYHE